MAVTDRRLADVATCLNYIQRFNADPKGPSRELLAARENVDQATWQGAAEFDYSPILVACQQGEARSAEIRGRR